MGLELVADVRRGNAEGPHWDSREGRLIFVAIPEGEVLSLRPDTGELKVRALGRPVGAVVTTRTPGRLLVALSDGLFFLDEATGGLTEVANPEASLPGNRFNDAKCDRAGRLYAGTMSHEEGAGFGGRGSLYRLSGRTLRTMATGVSVSNGIGFSPDDETMYYIDSPTRTVDAFDYDRENGNLENRRVFARIPEGLGVPDGMAADAEGGLWVALWGGYCVLRLSPDGREVDRIPVPAKCVSSCAFGDADLKTLYITTAGGGGRVDPEQPHAGGVFRIRVDAAGQPSERFDDSEYPPA